MLGCSGSGKTLLLRAIAGLSTPRSGQLRWHVQRSIAPSAQSAAPRLGFAFQRDALVDDLDTLHNVALGVAADTEAERTERALEVLQAVGLDAAAHQVPRQLSGGMRKRVGLARAIVGQPELLLCDDTTAGLDPSTGVEILELMLRLSRTEETAVLLATHDVDVVLPRADAVLFLEQGRQTFFGPPDAFAQRTAFAGFTPRAWDATKGT